MSGSWSDVEIDGKQVDVFEPSDLHGGPCVVLHLHGHGLKTLRDNDVFSGEFERRGLIAVCPHGQRSWWLDRICPEFDTETTPLRFLRNQVMPFIRDRWPVGAGVVGLSGISMGGQGVLQLAYRFPREFPVVAAVSPAVDFHNWFGAGLPLDQMFDDRETARQETATLQIHPLNWPRHQLLVCDPADADWFEGVERLAMKLGSSGIPFESDFETTNGGHSWEYFERMAPPVMEFVANRLSSINVGRS